MADYEKYPNSGILGKNDKMREGKQDPPYRGSCGIDGEEYWLSAWIKESKDGNKFFSLSFRNKKDDKAKPAAKKAAPKQEEAEDDIPF